MPGGRASLGGRSHWPARRGGAVRELPPSRRRGLGGLRAPLRGSGVAPQPLAPPGSTCRHALRGLAMPLAVTPRVPNGRPRLAKRPSFEHLGGGGHPGVPRAPSGFAASTRTGIGGASQPPTREGGSDALRRCAPVESGICLSRVVQSPFRTAKPEIFHIVGVPAERGAGTSRGVPCVFSVARALPEGCYTSPW